MGRAVGGAAAVGCGGLSFAGILVGVGLVVFLGSKAFEGVGDAGKAATTTAAAQPSVELSPTVDLIDGTTITVTGTGLDPGPALASTCLAALVEAGGTTACDPAADLEAIVGGDGRTEFDLEARRVIAVGDSRFDCAALDGGCVVLVHRPDAGTGPSSPLRFATDLTPTDAQPPPTPDP